MSIVRKTLFELDFSAVTQQQAVQTILQWANDDSVSPKRVVTPNVNLTVLQKRNPEFRRVLNESSLCLVDGKPIYWASHLFDVGLPEVVTGSDLVPALFAAHQANACGEKLRVFLLGAAEGVADKAARNIMEKYPAIYICGAYSPPFGFEHDPVECEKICQLIKSCNTCILIIGLGAPKQEFWADRHLDKTGAKVAICAGATIDFLAGEKSRAPAWMTKSGLEWMFRMLSEPKRLAKRYLKDGLALPGLFWAEYWRNRR
ncbi:WecB/TagA/CpsF family glycosyltransferase [Limnobacter parvus]|uniref:WecB/TagA/CpsF family glycosyltransferase n=1 Tax=Limnobacter parvus TaxID=2939690 RepID=A0ABT1XF53_9BURK|nr:WecB/TagA/CpsF family glycosyltransferase [Limnobacter parvus]MCR2745915.1 WecB/TagA/CpsF family glycosyltransferase [Limnobacter parvus]